LVWNILSKWTRREAAEAIPRKTMPTSQAAGTVDLRLPLIAVTAALAIGKLIQPWFGIENVDLVFLAVVVASRCVTGWPSLLASVLASLCYNDRVKRLAETDRLPSALLTSISHDLKTPLAAVLDLGLPDMDGQELLRVIRARDEAVPMLILSSRGMKPARFARSTWWGTITSPNPSVWTSSWPGSGRRFGIGCRFRVNDRSFDSAISRQTGGARDQAVRC
jgi:CheY-like chemotaxis protein